MSSSGAANELSSFTFQCPDEVVQRLARLYGDERHSDVTFLVQSNQDTAPQRFVAHRSIIAMWSEPLGSMLCGPFAEGSAKEVKLLDVEPAAFEVLLKLIYTGVVDISPETVLSILDVAVRFDVAALMQFSVQFLQNHATSEHACRMLEIGVQYHLGKLVDKCIELIVTDDHILESEDFNNLSQSAMIELAKHDAWNLHEDNIFDIFMRWSDANSGSADEKRRLAMPFLEQLRFPHMSTEKLKKLSTTGDVPSELLFEALFCKLSSEVEDESVCSPSAARRRQRVGSLLFSWVPTSRVTVSGELRENARHTSSSGFTGVRGDRRMRHGRFAWTIDITETQSSWIFVGVVQAEDLNDVAWRASGHMLYCLDSRFFHQGSGQNHPLGDRRMVSGDCIHVVLDCTRHTLAFGVNDEQPIILFRDLEATWYVPAVDLRDCGDKVRILSSRMTTFCAARSPSSSQAAISGPPEEAPWSGPSDESRPELEDRRGQISDSSRAARWQSDLPRRHTVQSPLETVPAFATRLSQPRQFGSASVLAVERGGSTLGRGGPAPRLQSPSAPRGPRGRATSQRGSSPGPSEEALQVREFLPLSCHLFVLVGGSRTGSNMHKDPKWSSAWNTLLCGKKRWVMFPRDTPAETIGAMEGDAYKDGGPPAYWWLDHYPRLAERAQELGMVDIIQRPGDTIFVPSGWWHATLNLPESSEDVTVACTRNIFPAETLDFVFPEMKKSDPAFARAFLEILQEKRPELMRFLPAASETSKPELVGEDPSWQLPRRHFSSLSLAECRRRFIRPKQPLIIEGLDPYLVSPETCHLSRDFLSRHFGEKMVAVFRNFRDPKQRDAEDEMEVMRLSQALSQLQRGGCEGLYLYDVSLPLKLPGLLEYLKLPRYFTHCYLQQTMRPHCFSKSWPTLFIGSAGSQARLHVDQWHSHFWMHLISGRKRWSIWHPEDTHLLCPEVLPGKVFPRFPDLSDLEAGKNGADGFHQARRIDVILEEGETLFVPGGAPHLVVNLTDTVAFAGNFMDESNFDEALADVKKMVSMEGKGEEGAMAGFAAALEEMVFDPDKSMHEEPLPGTMLAVRFSDFSQGRAAGWGPIPPDEDG